MRVVDRTRRAPRHRSHDAAEERTAEGRPLQWTPSRPAVSLDHGSLTTLQRSAGNQAVLTLFGGCGKAKAKGKGDHKPQTDEEEVEVVVSGKAKGKDGGARAAIQRVATPVQRFKVSGIPEGKMFEYKPHTVTPKFPLSRPLSKRSNSDSSTTTPKKPTISGTIAWDAGASQWRYSVDSITSPGTIQLVYYSWSHYPAPFPNNDAGPLFNVNKTNWKDIVKDLTDNRTGIADDWSAYLAEDLHEDYHWFQEWIPTITPKFTEAQSDIAAVGVSDTDANGDPVSYWDARADLRSQATQIFQARVQEGKNTFWGYGDSAGDPPYIAQAPAVDDLIARVQAHAATKGWT